MFGDIWTNLDGILIDTPVGASESTPNYVYIINDPDKFTDTLSDAPTNADRVVVSGHTGGYITKWALGEYADIIPVSVGGSATPTDVYVAINSQYHDYVELFKSWFGDNVDQKIIESAIIFWFKDVDCKSRNKVVSYFKEY